MCASLVSAGGRVSCIHIVGYTCGAPSSLSFLCQSRLGACFNCGYVATVRGLEVKLIRGVVCVEWMGLIYFAPDRRNHFNSNQADAGGVVFAI